MIDEGTYVSSYRICFCVAVFVKKVQKSGQGDSQKLRMIQMRSAYLIMMKWSVSTARRSMLKQRVAKCNHPELFGTQAAGA